jgi:hypothetical protein
VSQPIEKIIREEKKKRTEENNKRTIVFLSFLARSLSLVSNHMMLDVDITLLRAVGSKPTSVVGLAAVWRTRLIYTQTFCSCRQRQENKERVQHFSISLCSYESTHMRGRERMKKKINQGSNNSKLIVMMSCRSNVSLSCSLYLNI